MAYMNLLETINSLRAMADYLEANPSLDMGDGFKVDVSCGVDTGNDIAAVARCQGPWSKTPTNDWLFCLRREFAAEAKLEFYTFRSAVCVRKPTGRMTTERKLVTPAVYEDVEVPEVEWSCEPLLARDAS